MAINPLKAKKAEILARIMELKNIMVTLEEGASALSSEDPGGILRRLDSNIRLCNTIIAKSEDIKDAFKNYKIMVTSG